MPTNILTTQPDSPSGDNATGRRLLVVDDDECVRTYVGRLAEMEGFDVKMAANGRQAASELNRGCFDVVVTDIYMPEVDGLELIRWLGARRPAPQIIAMSGGGNYGFSLLEAASHLGATHVLTKPFVVAQLVDLLRDTR